MELDWFYIISVLSVWPAEFDAVNDSCFVLSVV